MAVRQTAGKGQRGAIWESEAGKNLTCSVLLYPTFIEPQRQFLLTVAVSVAVAQTLEEYTSAPVRIKWPNDIYVEDRKIAGMLIENQVRGTRWKSAVVGLGINVNQDVFAETIAERATSLKIVTGSAHDLRALLSRLCHYMGKAYGLLQRQGEGALRNAYHTRVFARDELRYFTVEGNVEVKGKILGVSELGDLLVDFNGYTVAFGAKEIAYVF